MDPHVIELRARPDPPPGVLKVREVASRVNGGAIMYWRGGVKMYHGLRR